MKTFKTQAIVFLLVCVPATAIGQESCSRVYSDAIKALASQYTSVTDEHDRYRYARCQMEESSSSSTDNGSSLFAAIPDVIEVDLSGNGGTSATTLKKSDCEAVRQRSDYFNATRTITPPSPGQLRELGRMFDSCVQANTSGRTYCQVLVDSPKIEVRLIYGTRPSESEPKIARAKAIIVDPKSIASAEERELFPVDTRIADKIPLSTSFTVSTARRINFDVATDKGPVECRTVTVNQAVSVIGRVAPILRHTSTSRARFSHNVFHNQCRGFSTGKQKKLRGCVPQDAKIVGHEFVNAPKKIADWKIIPGSTSFTIDPNLPNCFSAKASVWEPDINMFGPRREECLDHIKRGTDYFIDVDYTLESTTPGQTIDVAKADVTFPLEIDIPLASVDTTVESIDFHLTIIDEYGRMFTLNREARSAGTFNALVSDGRSKLVIFRSDASITNGQ